VQAIQDLGDLRSNASGYIAEKSVNEERAKNLLSLVNQKKAKLEEENTNLSIYDSNVKRAKSELREVLEEYNETLSNKNDANEAIKGINEDEVSLNSKRGFIESQLQLAIKAKSEYEQYQEAVKRLMVDCKTDPVLASKVLGVMAEVIVVPKEYESAIEYALGGNMQNILVENERDAGALISHLKQKNYGRATFRPRTACRRRSLQGYEREALNEQGCLGVAADLVTYEDKFDDFVSALLGNVVIVDTMLTAERIWKKYDRSFKIVTLDGEVYAKGGEVTGGSRRHATSGLLSQEAQIEQCKANLDRLNRNLNSLREQREERKREVELCDEAIESLTSKISELRIEASLNEDKAKASFEIVEALTAEISRDAAEYEIVKETVKSLAEKLSSIDELEAIVKSRGEEYNTLVNLQKTESGERKSERETLSTEVMNLRVRMTEIKSELDGFDGEIFRHKRDAETLEGDKLDLVAQVKGVTAQLDNILNAPEKTSFSEEDLRRIKELEASISNMSETKRKLSERILELDGIKKNLADEVNALTEKKIRDEGMLERIDSENRYLQEHILEEYDLTYTSALEFKDEEFVAHGAKTAISDLKKEINRLGEVNPLAIETLEETEKRHEEQVIQRDDIQAAYDDIFKIISELTTEMTGKFVSAFEKIQVNFKDVFTQLFGGGKGELRLDTSETDDPLEAGIEIYAQPPGKSLKHISLLSGGERAVTAIAILFSILSLKPMPFCVLDEIDAALDESNANLFAEFITKFSDYTQFIVITHRKPTMRHADSIFGVTMEERGVTKIVAIEFEDAVKATEGMEENDGLAMEA
jgi:chromosome segregation protein